MVEYIKNSLGSYISCEMPNGQKYEGELVAADNIGVMLKVHYTEAVYDYVCVPYSSGAVIAFEELMD